MSTWVIGDVQGCYFSLLNLLARVDFDADRDEVWFVGDLVNRGHGSLEVLRWAVAHDRCVKAVLGNHELGLFACAAGTRKLRRFDTLAAILEAPDRDELLGWLRARPMLHAGRGVVMVHAGLLPSWSLEVAARRAREIEGVLGSDGWIDALKTWRPKKKHGPAGWGVRDVDPAAPDRFAFGLNVFTQLRIVDDDGALDLTFKGPAEERPAGTTPWFDVRAANRNPGQLEAGDNTVAFGHWATLGVRQGPGWVALDGGCVWGGALAACRVEDGCIVTVPADQRDLQEELIKRD